MRTFIGIDLPDRWRNALSEGARVVREADERLARARWVPPENLHITLRFLGEIPTGSLDAITSGLTTVCEAAAPLELPLLDPVVPVRSATHATMLWTLFDDPDGACAALVADISDVVARFGVAPETKGYTPHVTLTRLRRPSATDPEVLALAGREVYACLDVPEPSMSVPQVTVFSSTLTRKGALYTRRARIELGRR